jgi:hypothetical protein
MKWLNNFYMMSITLIVFASFFSCKKSNKEIETFYLNSAVKQLSVNNTYKWAVILPGLGCNGCIQEGEAFMKEFVSNPDILFVLTKISSLKILQHKINIDIGDHRNIYIDRENLFDIPTNNAIYPCIIRLKKGEIESVEFQCPRTYLPPNQQRNLRSGRRFVVQGLHFGCAAFYTIRFEQTLYLQLMNEETRQVFWQEKYEIIKRFADGHVFLQDTLPEGNYLLMAFTQHSFFNDSSEFESFRRIIVKKDMKPRVSVKAEFSQPFFSEGEPIGVNILALSEQAKPMYAVITAELVKEGKIIETLKNATNTEGRCVLVFQTAKASPGLIVKVNVKHTNAVDEINLPVPFHKGSPIQFSTFPEGGYLVSGLKNKLAFKAVNINGEPVDIEGTLFENGDSLLRFKSVHAGMGSFEFTPDRNKKYHIKLNHPQSDSLWQLPEIPESGITLHLAECDSNFLVFKVKQNAGSIEKVVGLRGQLRGNVYFFTSGVLKEELEIKVAQKDFPQQGIAEFTLLDSTLSPIAERLVYMNSGNKLYIECPV